jgi:hypothetical protein
VHRDVLITLCIVFNSSFSTSDYIDPNVGRMFDNGRERMWKVKVVSRLNVLFHYLSRCTESNKGHEKGGPSVSQLKLKQDNF